MNEHNTVTYHLMISTYEVGLINITAIHNLFAVEAWRWMWKGFLSGQLLPALEGSWPRPRRQASSINIKKGLLYDQKIKEKSCSIFILCSCYITNNVEGLLIPEWQARATHICLDCGYIYTLQKPFDDQACILVIWISKALNLRSVCQALRNQSSIWIG